MSGEFLFAILLPSFVSVTGAEEQPFSPVTDVCSFAAPRLLGISFYFPMASAMG